MVLYIDIFVDLKLRNFLLLAILNMEAMHHFINSAQLDLLDTAEIREVIQRTWEQLLEKASPPM